MKRLLAYLLMVALILSGCAAPQSGEEAAPGDVVTKPEQSGESNAPEKVEPQKTSALGETLAPQEVSLQQPDDAFIEGQMSFSLALFQQATRKSKNENLLISPLSVAPALAMAANGAAGKTRAEMLEVLGGHSMEELNAYVGHYLQNLPAGEGAELKMANSIWIRSGFEVKESFLQKNADYYGAQIYEAPFNRQTIEDINDWVAENTDGMIEEIVEKLDDDTVMQLINALAFEGEWRIPFAAPKVANGYFTDIHGQDSLVPMMRSDEQYWLEDGKATGFLKDYKGNQYRFAALLPEDDVDIYDYIEGLTADGLLETLQSAENTAVGINLPKFSYEYGLELKKLLAEMGMPTAFDAADFSGMADEDLQIGSVLHKTFIEVDEAGTKAGAATDVSMQKYGGSPALKTVILNRPFVYMIIDTATNLPVFMGIVASIE